MNAWINALGIGSFWRHRLNNTISVTIIEESGGEKRPSGVGRGRGVGMRRIRFLGYQLSDSLACNVMYCNEQRFAHLQLGSVRQIIHATWEKPFCHARYILILDFVSQDSSQF